MAISVTILFDIACRYWHTWTSKIGYDVLGIWPEGSDGSDINSVCRDPRLKSLLVAGDDFGNVRLYKYPCVADNAGCKVSGGHSAHVVMVRWSNVYYRMTHSSA